MIGFAKKAKKCFERGGAWARVGGRVETDRRGRRSLQKAKKCFEGGRMIYRLRRMIYNALR